MKEISIDYLYLDLDTCDRCIGTDAVLEDVIVELTPALELAGYSISYSKIKIDNEELAVQHRFVSSPTIRVNGRDICDEVKESDCGCGCYEVPDNLKNFFEGKANKEPCCCGSSCCC